MSRLLFVVLLSFGCADTMSSEPWQLSEPPPEPTSRPDPSGEPGPTEEPEPDPEPEPESESDDELPQDAPELWSGLWRVDQPYHARYEGTVYDFEPDGTLTFIRSEILGGSEPYEEVGRVGKCAETHTETWEECETNGTECETVEHTTCVEYDPTCTFGDRWGSVDDRTLVIEGDCSDDVPHRIQIRFPADADIENGELLTPESITVEGEEWEHDWWRWAWSRCESGDADTCLPDF